MSTFTPIRRSLDGLLRSDWQRRVLVLRAYFDDSGTHQDSPAIVWAGFMAHVDEWSSIEVAWSAILKREGLRSLHMYELENGVGQCDQWSRARRDVVIRDFREVLRAHNIIGIGAVVRTADWAEVVAGTALEKRLPSPVLFAFEHAIQQALHWAETAAIQTGIAEKVDMFFDLREQDASTGLALAGAYGDREPWASWMKGAHFVRMRDTIPLQAADLLAYETYRLEHARARSGSKTELRPHMDALLKGVPIYGQFYDAEALRTLGAQIGNNEGLDLMRPQGSEPEKGMLTMAQKHKLLQGIDLLDEKGIDHVERAIADLPEDQRQEVRELIEGYIEQLRNAPKPTDDD